MPKGDLETLLKKARREEPVPDFRRVWRQAEAMGSPEIKVATGSSKNPVESWIEVRAGQDCGGGSSRCQYTSWSAPLVTDVSLLLRKMRAQCASYGVRG